MINVYQSLVGVYFYESCILTPRTENTVIKSKLPKHKVLFSIKPDVRVAPTPSPVSLVSKPNQLVKAQINLSIKKNQNGKYNETQAAGLLITIF